MNVVPILGPLAVTWAGPAIGVLLPILVLIVWRLVSAGALHFWRFFTGFCLITNGLYLAVGSFDRVGDAGDLLRHVPEPGSYGSSDCLPCPPVSHCGMGKEGTLGC